MRYTVRGWAESLARFAPPGSRSGTPSPGIGPARRQPLPKFPAGAGALQSAGSPGEMAGEVSIVVISQEPCVSCLFLYHILWSTIPKTIVLRIVRYSPCCQGRCSGSFRRCRAARGEGLARLCLRCLSSCRRSFRKKSLPIIQADSWILPGRFPLPVLPDGRILLSGRG